MAQKQFDFDITRIDHFLYDMRGCIKCKGCMWVDHIYMPGIRFSTRCPSATRYFFDSFGAYGKMRIGLAYIEKRLPPSDTLRHIFYVCTLCGACDVGCKRNLDLEIGLSLEALRVKLVRDGVGPMPAHQKKADEIFLCHNVFGYPHKKRGAWIPQKISPTKGAKTLYFAGCYGSYIHTEVSRATVKILEASGTPFQMMDDEWCCGNLLFSVGMIEEAKRQAERNLSIVRESGATTLLTSCAECYRMWKVDYPKILHLSTSELGFEVKHLTEFVHEAISEGRIKFSIPFEGKLAYHDSCSLSRLSEPWISWSGERQQWGILQPPLSRRRGTCGVYQSPREILNLIPGIHWAELHRKKENGFCCGAGRGTEDAFPDFAMWAAEQRLEEVVAIGAEGIISACPRCKSNFLRAVKKNQQELQVFDISEIILASIGGVKKERSGDRRH
ncbi:MAG: (Fe-S)-binding protein [Syntrophaceae bacterium]|nr:(Fe-S)-binding protein [Syntrophaceae bacterium]